MSCPCYPGFRELGQLRECTEIDFFNSFKDYWHPRNRFCIKTRMLFKLFQRQLVTCSDRQDFEEAWKDNGTKFLRHARNCQKVILEIHLTKCQCRLSRFRVLTFWRIASRSSNGKQSSIALLHVLVLVRGSNNSAAVSWQRRDCFYGEKSLWGYF